MLFPRGLIVLLAWLAFTPAVWARGWSDDPQIEARVEANILATSCSWYCLP